MRKKTCLYLLITLLFPLSIYSQNHFTRVYTDFNGGWDSQTQPTIQPNNSHNLLGFVWNGTTYSTGINDILFSTLPGTTGFNAQTFQAFPAVSSPVANSNTYIGVGSNYGGGDGNINPIPVNNNLTSYLTDGIRGLDLGTAIFNLPANNEIKYEITNINPASIGDGIPDLLITQIGQATNDTDAYRFIDINNATVGNIFNVGFASVPAIGNGNYKFYSPITTPPSYQPQLYGTRPMRFLAFDWSDLGITAFNHMNCKYFTQKVSGSSDIAFTAYNRLSVGVLQSISGTVFNDNNGGIPDGTPYANATIKLYNSANTLVATAVTASNGVYIFPGLSPGNYKIELTTPAGFQILGSADNGTDTILNVTLIDSPVNNQNFGINRPPPANNDSTSGELNTAIQINIAANDVDPNSGTVIPSTINLIPPAGAASIGTDGNGLVKNFTVVSVGSWSLDNFGLLTFTPVTGFTGITPITRYTVRDLAELISNQATIILTVEQYCTRFPNTISVGIWNHDSTKATGLARKYSKRFYCS